MKASFPRFVVLCFVLAFVAKVQGQTLPFPINGETVSLQRAESTAGVFFKAFRPNSATGKWDVDVIVTNGSAQTLRAPIVLRFDTAEQVSPGIVGAKIDAAGQPFLILTSKLNAGELKPGEALPPFTISLGDGRTRPILAVGLYSAPSAEFVPLAAAQTLSDDEIPLEGASITEVGPAQPKIFSSSRGGWVSLQMGADLIGWRFEAPGKATVFRKAIAANGSRVMEVPSPRLITRSASGPTVFSSQTIPAPIPAGWSPLGAALSAGDAYTLTLDEPIEDSGIAILAHWNDATFTWRMVSAVAPGTRNVSIESGGGLFAVLRADAAPVSPLMPSTGQAVEGISPTVNVDTLAATAVASPPLRTASRDPSLVRTEATVEFTSAAGPLSSGLVVPCEVFQEYRLRDGSRRVLPAFRTTLIGYQRPRGATAGSLIARFSLRPIQLLAGDELAEALVHVQALKPSEFTGAIIDSAGGAISSGAIRINIAANDFEQPQAALLREIHLGAGTEIAPPGLELVGAFELSIGATAPGRRLSLAFSGQTPNTNFVLTRAVFDEARHGFQPVHRFSSDASGVLRSSEPATGGLAGIDGGGQYLVFRTAAAEAVVNGTARDATGAGKRGLIVRRGPWTAFSEEGGAFKLLAPAGSSDVTVLDRTSGDSGSSAIETPTNLASVQAIVDSVARGPRVVDVSPTNAAVNVPRIASIVVTFDKPMNAGALLSDGLVLKGRDNAVVPTSLSLNLKGTVATLLPLNPLEPSVTHTIAISPLVSDASGRNVEGTLLFSFKTESDFLNRVAGQLTIYEPLNGRAGVSGSPGTADPEAPVVLVNETTGQTATVLSKVDGSFTNDITADVDDMISAVLVSRNGARLTLPASRQIFRDGSVALFQGGGGLEASNDAGSVQIVIPPGAIPEKTRFFIEPISAAELMALIDNVPPASGKVVGALNFRTEGNQLIAPAKVKTKIDPATFDLPAGVVPEDANFVLTTPRVIDGVPVYEVLDKMKFKDGELSTASPPFPGLLQTVVLAIVKAANGGQVPVAGTVFSALPLPTGGFDETTFKPVPGAVVFVNEAGVALNANGKLAAGALVATADEKGAFALMAKGQSLGPAGTGFSFLAMSPLFPGRFGTGSAISQPTSDLSSGAGRVIFDRTTPTLQLGGTDLIPPVVSVTHTPQFPGIGATARIRLLVSDDRQMGSATVTLQGVQGTDPATPVTISDATLTGPLSGQTDGQVLREEYDLKGNKPLIAQVRIEARDSQNNTQTVVYPIPFGAAPIITNPTPDPGDTNGPFVISSKPTIGAQNHPLGKPITITFNEPLDPAFMSNPASAFFLTPTEGTPVAELSPDHKTVSLTYYKLKPDTQYTLAVTPTIQDINGNGMDQNPYNTVTFESFILHFKTAPLPSVALPQVASGGGVALIGRTLFALDRDSSAVTIVDVSQPTPVFVNKFPLNVFPRDLIAIPGFKFKTDLTGPIRTNDLLVAVGGAVAGEGQWIEVIDVTHPTVPAKVGSVLATRSGSAALVKLAWSPPVIGFLESDADVTSIALINLQLFLYARNLPDNALALEPAGGLAGEDKNGDGDYVDPGETLPRLDGTQPRLGLINGGLVAQHTLANETTQRIQDFALDFGGRFIGVAMTEGKEVGANGQPTTTVVPPSYITLLTGGVRQDRTATDIALPVNPKRVFTLFGAEIETAAGRRLANLALVSVGQFVRVIDITDPQNPATLTDIEIPVLHGIPQSILRRNDGILMLATSLDILLLNPLKLGLVAPTGTTHPALVGVIPGAGSGVRSFVGTSAGGYALASGGNSRVFGSFGLVNLTMHRPGAFTSPGVAVPDSAEEQPFEVIVAVNDDHDDHVFPPTDTDLHNRFVAQNAVYSAGTPTSAHPPENDLVDNRDQSVSIDDDDLVQIVLNPVPPVLNGQFGFVELEVTGPDPSKPLPVRVMASLLPGGDPVPLAGGISSTPNTILYRINLADTTPLHPLRHLREGEVEIFFEGLAPATGVKVAFRYLDRDGVTLIDEDKAAFTVAKVRVLEVWSDQFSGMRHNRLPNNAGGKIEPRQGRYERNPNTPYFLLFGNRADNRTYVKSLIEVTPNLPQIANRVRTALYHHNTSKPREPLVFGESSPEANGSVSALSSDDPRGSNFLLYGGDFYYEHFLVAGFDYNGDGILQLREVTHTFGTAYVAGDEMIYSVTNPSAVVAGIAVPETRFRIKDDHLKIVNQTAFNFWQNCVSVIAGVGFGVNGAFALFNQLFPGITTDVKSLSAFHLAFYATGFQVQPPAGITIGTTTIHADGDLGANVGAIYAADGSAQVPLFTYGAASGIGADIIASGRYRLHLQRLLDSNVAKLNNFFRNNPTVTEADFDLSPTTTAAMSFDFDACFAIPDWNAATVLEISSRVTTALSHPLDDCADVFNYGLGIGRAGINYSKCKFHIKASPMPFVFNVTKYEATSAEVTASMEDIYDWDLNINFPLAIIEAGHGTLGQGGKVFKDIVDLNGPVPNFFYAFPSP